ncbi:hypothetical protein [Rickettsia endosymbiont of Rhinocyllus conicus]
MSDTYFDGVGVEAIASFLERNNEIISLSFTLCGKTSEESTAKLLTPV